VTGAVFVADAEDSASFSCVSDPSFPYDPMRIGSLELEAPSWFADEAANAPWPISLDCPIA
jgi:hypothetical protein